MSIKITNAIVVINIILEIWDSGHCADIRELDAGTD